MRDAVIVSAIRTPVGKRNGALAAVHAADLSAVTLQALADEASIDPAWIDDVLWGCVTQIGEQTFDIARTAVLSAGWPETVTGVTIDRQCGSSQQAVHFAAAGVISGQYDVAVAGGVEMMSRTPMGSAQTADTLGGLYRQRYGADFPHQGIGAEQVAERWDLSRQALDEFSLRSHRLAAEARAAGLFDAQIAAVDTPDGRIDQDEGIRVGGTVDQLAALKTPFLEGGRVTAGNSSQISDGAAALLVTTSEFAKAHGLVPLVRIHTAVLAGDAPMPMLTAPLPATRRALSKSGLQLDDIDVFEVNEAFAAVPLAWIKEFGGSDSARLQERTNPRGGAIALGHPLGASGARIMTTLVHQMRAFGLRYGMQTMCEAGGQANATILELL